ncbi:MAG: hypothetical protein J5780_04200 [Treponema sp.]|nr:hypothetical protein [Treponema sp.]
MKKLMMISAVFAVVFAQAFISCKKHSSENSSKSRESFELFHYDENGEIIMNTNGYTEWAGCRRSSYGFNHTKPSVQDMTSYVQTMESFYNKSKDKKATGALVWIVGEVSGSKAYSCKLNFPKPDGKDIPSDILFAKEDINEEYLTAFDKAGFDVWLQVEPGFVDIEKLATIVMTKYRNHKCVKGFGIDTEWYKNTTDGNDGTALDDETAQKVDAAVKKVNPSYSVFVKHWDTAFLPPTYRGVNNDMIFVTDSQFFESLEEMKSHYSEWADYYAPNPVFFQIGYYGKENWKSEDLGLDEKIWKSFDRPLKNFGTEILKCLSDNGQKRGIIWVDFTFQDALNLSK